MPWIAATPASLYTALASYGPFSFCRRLAMHPQPRASLLSLAATLGLACCLTLAGCDTDSASGAPDNPPKPKPVVHHEPAPKPQPKPQPTPATIEDHDHGHEHDHGHSHNTNASQDEPLSRPVDKAFVPRPALNSEPTAGPAPAPVGDPYHDGCLRAETSLDDAPLKTEHIYYTADWRLKARQTVDAGSDYYFQTEYEYDDAGRLARMISLYGGVEEFEHEYQYDEGGRLSNYRVLEWRVPAYGDEIDRQTLEEAYTLRYTYGDDGALKSETQFFDRQPGLSTHYDHDEQGRLWRRVKSFQQISADPTTGFNTSKQEVSEIAMFDYGDDDTVTIRYSRPTGEGGDTLDLGTETRRYEAGRLTHTTRAPGAAGGETLTERRAYDELGRLLTLTRKTPAGTQVTTYTYK